METHGAHLPRGDPGGQPHPHCGPANGELPLRSHRIPKQLYIFAVGPQGPGHPIAEVVDHLSQDQPLRVSDLKDKLASLPAEPHRHLLPIGQHFLHLEAQAVAFPGGEAVGVRDAPEDAVAGEVELHGELFLDQHVA